MEKPTIGNATAWAAPTDASTGVRNSSRIGTSRTAPPVPVSAEPKPTKAPTASKAGAPRRRARPASSGRLSRVSAPVSTISEARMAISRPSGRAVLANAPTNAVGTPTPSQATIRQSMLRRPE